MPSFEDIRSRYPGAKDLTDEEIIQRTAEITKLPLSIVAEDFGYTPQSRNVGTFAKDTVIGIGSAALGGASAIGDFFVPGNKVSNAINDGVKQVEETQSLPVRLGREKLNEALNTDDIATQARGVKDYVLQNPVQAAAMGVGSFIIPGSAIKGVKYGAKALELGTKLAGRVATGAGVVTGGVLAGGDAAGDAYDQVYNSKNLADYTPEERDALATEAARKAQVAPTLIGAVGGLFGADKALATGTRSILKTAGAEFLSEAAEEGSTKLSANVAAGQYDSEIKPFTGVAGASLLGGVLGGGTGLSIGAMEKTRPAGSFLDGSGNTGENSSVEGGAINKAIDENSQPIPVGPIPQSAAYGPNLPEQAGPPAPNPSQQAADQAQLEVQRQQQVQQQAAAQQEQQREARSQVFRKYGGLETTIPNGTKPMWQYLGKNYFTLDSLSKAVDQQVAKEAQKPELVRQVEDAVTQTYQAVGLKPYTPGKMSSFVAPLTEQAESIDEVLSRIDAELGTLKENTPQSDSLKALRNVLMGKPAEFVGDANPAPEAKSPTAEKLDNAFAVMKDGVEVPIQVVAERLGTNQNGEREVVALVDGQEQNIPISQIVVKQGVQDERLQLQADAGVGTIPTQISTTGNDSTGNNGQQVDLVGPGSVGLGQNPEQDVSGGEVQSQLASGSNVDGNANSSSDRQEALSQVRKIFTELFGSVRDANIIMELQDDSNPQTQAEIAAKYGVNQSTVSRVLKVLQSDTLGPRFFLAAKKLGYSKEEVGFLIKAIEDSGLSEDTNEDLVDDSAAQISQENDADILNTNADDVNPAFSDDAVVNKLSNEEVFGDEETGDKGGYAILENVAGTKVADASSANKTRVKYKREGSNWKNYEDFELQNLIADKIAKKADLPGIIEEVKRREAIRVAKSSKTAAKAETKVEAKEDLNLTTEEQAANAWDKVASTIANAPLFEELSEEQQQDFIDFGPENWTAADVNTELNKLADSPKFSAEAKKVTNAWSASELKKNLSSTFATNESFNDLVTIVDVFEELPADLQAESKKQRASSKGIKGIAYEGKVYLIAGQIAKGQELGVMLHELGAHIGMKNLVGEYNYKKLIEQIQYWASGAGSKTNPFESVIANRAWSRADESSSAGSHKDEILAYFIEEAVLAGVSPSATKVSSNQIVQMLRSLVAAMRVALRKLGFSNFDSLTADDLVNLAFGAAKMELDGTYHGTDSKFRKFLDDKISNVLSGWGHYTTNDKAESKTYGEKTIRSLFMGDRKDLIENDRPLEDQPAVLKKLRAVADADFQEFLKEQGVQIDGGDLQEALGQYEVDSGGGLYKLLSNDAKDRVVDVKEIVSTFLAEQGIPGSTFKPYGRGMPNRQTIVFQGKDVARVSQEIDGELKFSVASARKETQKRIDRMPKAYRGTVQKMFDFLTTKNLTDRTVANFAFTRDVTDAAAKIGLKSAQTFQRLSDARKQILGSYSSRIEAILEDFNKLTDASLKSTGPNSVNRFIKDSTVDGKWGFQPEWLSKQVTVDPVMADRFNAIEKQSPKAAQIIKAVFKYNFDVNQAMKTAVLDSISSEFDSMIAQAKKDGDIKEEADLLKKKADSISEYQTLLRIRNEKPYAALRRFGNIVVVGKSQAYLDAEDANDTAEIRKLETDENHYVVRFAETNGEAQAIYRSMQGKYDYLTEPFDSADADASVYGGRDLNALFYRLRNVANSEEGSDATSKGMNRLLNDLHLRLLSEQSVRQAENRRKNITGSDDDMMRAFVSQGRAAAHFVSSLTNSAGIYDSLKDMRKERDARTPGKDVRSIYYNEIMARHGMEMAYNPTPIVDAALNVTSTWMLLTSPGYYFQNITQPFLISLPYIGANPKFGYNKSVAEFLKAYNDVKELVGLTKKGLSEADYNKLPADVRGVIEELVNRGSINISLSAELGRFRSSVAENPDIADKGMQLYNKGTDMLRGFAENIESINRLTTAMTAYRLAVKAGQSNESAIDYADKVIYNTHGDYSGANAPRFMRTGVGRIATQFRKFQLIQISLLARMWNDWKKSATPEERIVAKRQLMFTVGHTFAVGGIMGLPGFTALAFLWGAMFGDDDEPDNPELTLRRLIGNDDLADLLVKGVPAFMGVDVSGKLGMGQMLSVLPYTDFKLNKDSVNQAAVALVGGPFLGGLVPRAARGAEYLAAGEYYKGIEQLMPKGIGDVMKGLRIGTEGLTNKNGDVQLNADEISFMDAFMTGLGLPTTTLTKRQFAESAKYQFDEFFNGKTTELKNQYAKAYRAGDAQSMAEARQKWMELQESRVKNGYSRQPLSTLIKAPMEQRKRERESAGGVSFSKGNRRFVQGLSGD